jgi:SAM-dependent methyltransferase
MTANESQPAAPAAHQFFFEWGVHAIMRLIEAYDFDTVLDIGSGQGEHARFFRHFGKEVYAVNLSGNADYVGDFNELALDRQFDAVWCSHVIEHQRNVGVFLERIFAALKDDGILALTAPCHPRERLIDGHLTSWNAGLLCYNLILAGFDCSRACLLQTFELNLIVRKKQALLTEQGRSIAPSATTPLEKLAPFFPFPVRSTGNAEVLDVKWGEREYELPPALYPGEIRITSSHTTFS